MDLALSQKKMRGSGIEIYVLAAGAFSDIVRDRPVGSPHFRGRRLELARKSPLGGSVGNHCYKLVRATWYCPALKGFYGVRHVWVTTLGAG